MLKAFRNSTVAVRFYRCQRFSHSSHKLSRCYISPQGYFKCSPSLSNYKNVAFSSIVPTRPFSTVDLDDDNDSDGLEEVYDELSENADSGCERIKNFLYKHLTDDKLLNEINGCESEDDVSTVGFYVS